MINQVVLTGRITKPLALYSTSNGRKYTRFTLAVQRTNFRDGQKEADFIPCIAWGKTAETMNQYLNKGSLIGVEGRIQTGSYEKQGQSIYTVDVLVNEFTFLESKKTTNNVEIPEEEIAGIDNENLPF